MINDEISKQVLTVGCRYKHPKGGVAQVLYNYSCFVFQDFKFIANSGGRNKLHKLIKAISSFLETCCLLIFDRDIKIVHIHTASYNSFKRSAWFVRLAKMFRKKVILHIHGGGFKEYYATNAKWISSVLERSDAIITLSNSWRRFFQSIVKRPAVFVVENIVPFPVQQTAKEDDGKFHLLFLGLISKGKGIFDLIEVLHENVKSFSDNVLLHIGGNGEVGLLNKKVKEYGLEGCVRYEGFVSGDKKIRLLNEADAFILPSYTEGLPVSILEAMSYKKPILTTPVGGIPEIVKQNVNGILFQPGDKIAISKAIEQIMNNDVEKEVMGEKAYQMVQSFLPVNVEMRLEEVYKWLLDN